jgi:hypothetical protein
MGVQEWRGMGGCGHLIRYTRSDRVYVGRMKFVGAFSCGQTSKVTGGLGTGMNERRTHTRSPRDSDGLSIYLQRRDREKNPA